MADAIDRLVDRTFHPYAAVRPRLESRFRNASDDREPANGIDITDSARTNDEPAFAPPPRRSTDPSRPSGSASPTSPGTGRRSSGRPTPHVRASEPTAAAGEVSPPSGRTDEVPLRSPADTSDATWPSDVDEEERVVEVAGTPSVSARLSSTDVHKSTTATSAESPTFGRPPRPELRPAPSVSSPAGDLTRTRAVSDRSEPVIHITIGRVEVRADIASSRAPAERRPSGPRVMPLDEYLERRARGTTP
jgi:hypothetical protein